MPRLRWLTANEKPVVATAPKVAEKTQGVLNLLPAKVVAAFQASGGTDSAMPSGEALLRI